MEEVLTLDELYLLRGAAAEIEYRHNKFAAGLEGIDLEEEVNKQKSSFDDVKRRVEAELAGKTEEEYVFDLIGIEVEADD